MKTAFLLMAFYDGRPVIPVAEVCADFFAPLTLDKFMRKVGSGEIPLPIIRMERSQKGAKGVHLVDLAEFIDARRQEAKQELTAITGKTRKQRLGGDDGVA